MQVDCVSTSLDKLSNFGENLIFLVECPMFFVIVILGAMALGVVQI